jgi:NADH-quinone oxidoreductase subunit L
MMYFYTWFPVKWVGKNLSFLKWKRSKYLIPIFLLLSLVTYWVDLEFHIQFLPELYGGLALLLALKSFSEKRSVHQAFFLIVFNHLFIALAVFFNEHLTWWEVTIYISGVLAAGIVGLFVLNYLSKKKEDIVLNRFHGHSYEYPYTSILFLLACLGLTGFPISPTFLGEDLIFSHIHEGQFLLAFLVACSFVIDCL